jgi:hypothetical protein
MKRTPISFWFGQISNFGLFPCLTLLQDYEDREEYEICADIINAIKYLDVNLPEDEPRPTREGEAWRKYAKFWSAQKLSPILIADQMSRYAEKEAVEYYKKIVYES